MPRVKFRGQTFQSNRCFEEFKASCEAAGENWRNSLSAPSNVKLEPGIVDLTFSDSDDDQPKSNVKTIVSKNLHVPPKFVNSSPLEPLKLRCGSGQISEEELAEFEKIEILQEPPSTSQVKLVQIEGLSAMCDYKCVFYMLKRFGKIKSIYMYQYKLPAPASPLDRRHAAIAKFDSSMCKKEAIKQATLKHFNRPLKFTSWPLTKLRKTVKSTKQLKASKRSRKRPAAQLVPSIAANKRRSQRLTLKGNRCYNYDYDGYDFE